MRTYKLETPKDAHGQPIRLFKANLENNVSKAIDQLSGICAGILADGKVNEKEAVFFADWVRKFAPYEPIWPFTDILTRVDRIFADGRCDKEELEELKSLMEELCGQNKDVKPKETYSTTLPLDSPKPDPVVLVDRIVNITGRFAFGTRKKVMTAIEEEGGIPSGSTPTKKSNYLVYSRAVIGTTQIMAGKSNVQLNYANQKVELQLSRKSIGESL